MVWVGREFADHVVPTSCHGWNSQSPWDLVVSIISMMLLPDYLPFRTRTIFTATTALFSTVPAVSLLTLPVLFLLTILEVAVAIIQPYVFVLLLSLYLQVNI
uniref:Uncharacterized protein n=1 Tax=Junco hyemalis TaxID=40217 RepID=A0A8C5ID49_JUNHY